MSRTIVSWTKFCEWMQGKKVLAELDVSNRTIITFVDRSTAIIYSGFDTKFGEIVVEAPVVEITEAP